MGDIENALEWLRNEGEDKSADDSVFSKIEGLLPASKVGQSDLERAKELENALNWLRSNGVDIDNITDQPTSKFNTIQHTSMDSFGKAKEQKKADAMTNALSWL